LNLKADDKSDGKDTKKTTNIALRHGKMLFFLYKMTENDIFM